MSDQELIRILKVSHPVGNYLKSFAGAGGCCYPGQILANRAGEESENI